MESLHVQPNELHIAVIPTGDIISWLHSRSYFIALKARGKAPDRYGAMSESSEAWVYWYHDFRKQQLWIQHMRVPVEAEDSHTLVDTLASLLLDALEEANEWQLSAVVIRSPQPCVLRFMQILASRCGVLVDNDALVGRSVASVRVGDLDKNTTVTLQFNELYAWS